jgi:hypothetical protein
MSLLRGCAPSPGFCTRIGPGSKETTELQHWGITDRQEYPESIRLKNEAPSRLCAAGLFCDWRLHLYEWGESESFSSRTSRSSSFE